MMKLLMILNSTTLTRKVTTSMLAALALAGMTGTAHAFEHLDCSAAYQALATVNPSFGPVTTPRVDAAIQAYKADPPPATAGPTPVTDGEIRAEVEARTKSRMKSVNAGLSGSQALAADVKACDAKYGHAPIASQ